MKTFSEFMEAIAEAISYRTKHKGATHKMSAGAKKDVKKREKKKAALGIDKDSKFKLGKDGKKVPKTKAELKRKVVTRN